MTQAMPDRRLAGQQENAPRGTQCSLPRAVQRDHRQAQSIGGSRQLSGAGVGRAAALQPPCKPCLLLLAPPTAMDFDYKRRAAAASRGKPRESSR